MIKKLILIVAVNATLFAMGGGPSLVEVTKLQKGVVNPLQEFVGTLSFYKQSVLAAQNSGVVKSVKFEVGDRVTKDQLLLQIDSDLLNAQISAANANFQLAIEQEKSSSKDYNRYKKLLVSKSITQKEYDDALLKLTSSSSNTKALRAKLNELQIHRAKKDIKAPFSGVIVQKSINIGEWANTGTPVAKLVDTTVAEITFNVPLSVVKGLKEGDIYDIKVGQNILKSKLNAIIPNGDKLTRTFPVKFLANTKKHFVFDGQQAKVSLSKNGKKSSLILPRDAVIKRFGQSVVFAVNEKNMAQMIPVQIEGYVGNKIAIAGQGLLPGMSIVSKGNERVFPNTPVKIINE
jgi:RND family efflux transporter MFP subunit